MADSAPPRLVLASGSPRRAEILRRLGLEFTVRVPDVEEVLLPGEDPVAAAERLARAKAESRMEPGSLTLGCDTIVVHGDAVLGKPADPEEAVAMLYRLSGSEHRVHTGIALAAAGRTESALETTRVRFRSLDSGEIRAYVATGEPLDKAGAYGIQRRGAALVEHIRGDYFNVVGLPVGRFLALLARHGWRYAFGSLVRLSAAAPNSAGASHGPAAPDRTAAPDSAAAEAEEPAP